MKTYSLLICGSRSITDEQTVIDKLDDLIFNVLMFDLDKLIIISGKAKGPDSIAIQWAKKYNRPIKKFPAEWDRFGKSAGYIRNREMVKEADFIIAFWDTESKGTLHTIKLAKEKGIPIHVEIM